MISGVPYIAAQVASRTPGGGYVRLPVSHSVMIIFTSVDLQRKRYVLYHVYL